MCMHWWLHSPFRTGKLQRSHGCGTHQQSAVAINDQPHMTGRMRSHSTISLRFSSFTFIFLSFVLPRRKTAQFCTVYSLFDDNAGNCGRNYQKNYWSIDLSYTRKLTCANRHSRTYVSVLFYYNSWFCWYVYKISTLGKIECIASWKKSECEARDCMQPVLPISIQRIGQAWLRTCVWKTINEEG